MSTTDTFPKKKRPSLALSSSEPSSSSSRDDDDNKNVEIIDLCHNNNNNNNNNNDNVKRSRHKYSEHDTNNINERDAIIVDGLASDGISNDSDNNNGIQKKEDVHVVVINDGVTTTSVAAANTIVSKSTTSSPSAVAVAPQTSSTSSSNKVVIDLLSDDDDDDDNNEGNRKRKGNGGTIIKNATSTSIMPLLSIQQQQLNEIRAMKHAAYKNNNKSNSNSNSDSNNKEKHHTNQINKKNKNSHEQEQEQFNYYELRIVTCVGMKFCSSSTTDSSLTVRNRNDPITFELEPENQFDANAISVLLAVGGCNNSDDATITTIKKIGYVSKDDNDDELRQLLFNNSNTNSIQAYIGFKSENLLLLFVKVYHHHDLPKNNNENGGDLSSSFNNIWFLRDYGNNKNDLYKKNNKKDAILEATSAQGNGWIRWPAPTKSVSSSSLESKKRIIISLEDYLLNVRPSQIEKSVNTHWIAIDNVNMHSLGHSNQKETNYSNHDNYSIRQYCTTTNNKTGNNVAVLEQAIRTKNLVGKWLLFFSSSNKEKLDSSWMKIASATAQGKLGCSSKILPGGGTRNNGSVVCCVYVNDFTHRQEVKRVLVELQKLLVGTTTTTTSQQKQKVSSGFKPDVYTDHDISGTIYKGKDVLLWE